MADKDSMSDRTFEMLRDDIKESKEATEKVHREVKRGFEKLDNRVRKLENWRSGIVATGTFVIIVGGVLLKIFA